MVDGVANSVNFINSNCVTALVDDEGVDSAMCGKHDVGRIKSLSV